MRGSDLAAPMLRALAGLIAVVAVCALLVGVVVGAIVGGWW